MSGDAENGHNKTIAGLDQPVGNLESTQTRNGQRTLGGVGDGIAAEPPDAGGNRSVGRGYVSQQSGPKSDLEPGSRANGDEAGSDTERG